MAKRKQLTNNELLAICERKAKDATTFASDTLSQERAETLKYYLGKPFGNEQEGRSQVVTRDVAEAVDTLMPELIEVFVASDRPLMFRPTGMEDVEAAQQATDYITWIWESRGGIMLLYHWLKDGLLHKRGVVRVDWEESEERVPENYEGLTGEQVSMLATDENIEIASITVRPSAMDESASVGAGPVEGMALPAPALYDVQARRVNKTGRVTYRAVPPDEFMIDRNAVNEWEAPFVGQRSKKNRTELLDMGFPESVVDDLPKEDTEAEFSQERIDRFADDAAGGSLPREEADEATEEIWVKEVYIKVDFDGDGKAEYRKVIYAGTHILVNEEVNDHPFASWCPHPIPHKFWGQSVADQAKDIQLIKSTILRQILDNLYLSNNPEKAVVEGAVNLEDLLVSRPGGIKRMRAPHMIENFEYPFVAGQSFPVIEWLDQNLERRTGAFRYNQGLDPDSLNKTATGITKIMNAGQRRVRLMARLFAETGLRRLFQRTLELVVKHQQIAEIIELRGGWVPMDPRNWRTNRDMVVNVGAGSNNGEMLVAQLMRLLEIDGAIIKMQGGLGGPLVTASNVHNKLTKLVEAMGLKPAGMFYAPPPPEADQPQQPPPDPEMVKAQAEIQRKNTELQATLAMKQAELQAELQRKQVEMQAKLALEREKAMLELQLRREEHAMEMQIRREEAAQEAQHEKIELAADIALKNKAIEQKASANTNVRDPDNSRREAA